MSTFPQAVVLKAICHTCPKNFPPLTIRKSPSTLHKASLKTTRLTYIPSPIKLQTQLLRKFQSYTKPVKHIRSFPATNIQHGFLAKNIF
jgi:hypothetical protein